MTATFTSLSKNSATFTPQTTSGLVGFDDASVDFNSTTVGFDGSISAEQTKSATVTLTSQNKS